MKLALLVNREHAIDTNPQSSGMVLKERGHPFPWDRDGTRLAVAYGVYVSFGADPHGAVIRRQHRPGAVGRQALTGRECNYTAVAEEVQTF